MEKIKPSEETKRESDSTLKNYGDPKGLALVKRFNACTKSVLCALVLTNQCVVITGRDPVVRVFCPISFIKIKALEQGGRSC